MQSVRECLSLGRLLSTYYLSKMITLPKGERFRINDDTSIRCLSNPEKSTGTLFILQGGTLHMNCNTYYVRTACMFVPKDVRIFIFEKSKPVVNPEFAHDVEEAIEFIKARHPEPLAVVGYSMGGILLWSYLALGYHSADFYVPTCCPLDFKRFREVLENNAVFRMIQTREYKKHKASGYEDLLKMSGTTMNDHDRFTEDFPQRLSRTVDNWREKTVYVISSDDPATSIEDLKLMSKPPHTYLVQGGWHCCLDSTFLSITLACNALRAHQTNPNSMQSVQPLLEKFR